MINIMCKYTKIKSNKLLCDVKEKKNEGFTDSKTADSKLTQPVVAPFAGASLCLCCRSWDSWNVQASSGQGVQVRGGAPYPPSGVWWR